MTRGIGIQNDINEIHKNNKWPEVIVVIAAGVIMEIEIKWSGSLGEYQ